MKFNKKSGEKKDWERTAFLVLLLIMAVYYGYRMFALTPWYDELYTYYYFISRGPVYAAIHWPLPNNHVGYSVLSAFLDLLGNPYIGLRGVSYLCALANLVLIFAIGRNFLYQGLSFAAVVLYASVNLVNQLAVQGRGYTLGVTCYLTAFFCLIVIGTGEKVKKRYYVMFALSLVLGLYTLTSDVYWVLALCLAGGCYLLYRGVYEKRKEVSLEKPEACKRLWKLILSSLVAAAVTFFLYTIIWLAIGSNLLVKEAGGIYFGLGHVEVILKAPFAAMGAGMEYMLATPYIQSVAREGFLGKLYEWFLALFQMYYGGLSYVILVIFLAGAVFLAIRLVMGMKRGEKKEVLLILFLLTGIICTPLFLLIQCTLPYYRVFAYGGVLLALLIVYLVQVLYEGCRKRKHRQEKQKESGMAVVPAAAALLLAGYYFLFTGYSEQYGTREAEIEDALSHAEINETMELCVTDCTQQYLMKFLYGITCENTQIEGADMVLLDRKMLDEDYDEMEWEFYHYYQTIPWDYVNGQLEKKYENDGFVLYMK